MPCRISQFHPYGISRSWRIKYRHLSHVITEWNYFDSYLLYFYNEMEMKLTENGFSLIGCVMNDWDNKKQINWSIYKKFDKLQAAGVFWNPLVKRKWYTAARKRRHEICFDLSQYSVKTITHPLCCSVAEAVLFTQGSMTFFCVTNEVQGLKYELLVFALGR